MFIKELELYINYFREIAESITDYSNELQLKQAEQFRKNINDGINYYKSIFSGIKSGLENVREDLLNQLEKFEYELNKIWIENSICSENN